MNYPIPELLDRLTHAQLKAHGFLANASNHTMLVSVGQLTDGVAAVYKPQTGERPLWDYPHGSLARREAAAYQVDAWLGWEIVPPTVYRDEAPHGPGSLQMFIPHDPEVHYFTLIDNPDNHPVLARMALFDLLINNGDRKGSHIMRADDGHLWGCDHGLAFHTEPKLRTVIWELGGRPIPDTDRKALTAFADAVAEEGLGTELAQMLTPNEIDRLAERASILSNLRRLPEVEPDHRSYPWPPL